MSRNVKKRTVGQTRPTKIQISLRISTLIRIFTAHILGNQECKVASCGQRSLSSDYVDAQTDLNIFWAHMFECIFSDFATQKSIRLKPSALTPSFSQAQKAVDGSGTTTIDKPNDSGGTSKHDLSEQELEGKLYQISYLT